MDIPHVKKYARGAAEASNFDEARAAWETQQLQLHDRIAALSIDEVLGQGGSQKAHS